MNDSRIFAFLPIMFGLLTLYITPVQAQDDNTYFIANQMLQRQEYQRAAELFEELHKRNPANFLFLEKATESLINLKQYDKAIEMTQNAASQQYYPERAEIRLGEIYHVRGDTKKAYQIWDEIHKNNKRNLEITLALARAMRDRRAFDRAIKTYKDAAKLFTNSTVLSSELANTYMQAGKYEESIKEYLKLIRDNPDRINYVQSTLLRFNDEYLYDIAILEIGDFLEDLPLNHPAHRDLHQLEIWLLLERELYERALATARNYEESLPHTTYSLYGLGAKLLSERQYELAEQAYRYYVEKNISSAKFQSLEEIGNVYIEWANYLADFNLSSIDKRNELYNKAFKTLTKLQNEAPNYRNLDRILITQSELALDHLHDPGKAGQYLAKLNQQADSSNLAQRNYIQGRIHLYNKEYDRARIAFTKSNKQVRIGELAEKTRYYLALSDFYAGDYEFAKIQLNALERQSTSYFANDAVKLRVWIQDGLQADSTGASLQPFAKAVELFSHGKDDQAMDQLRPVLSPQAFHPLTDEALLEISTHITPEITDITYNLITRFLSTNGRFSPLRERLMWEKARIGDQVMNNPKLSFPKSYADQIKDTLTLEEQSYGSSTSQSPKVSFPSDKSQVIALYEEILLEFPNGFYASFARNRIHELQNLGT